MVFVSDCILVPTPCASRPISFANEFYHMALVGPLTRCIYSIDAPVFGSMKNLLDDVPSDLSLVLQHVVLLSPLFFLALWYCTGVLTAVGHTCFLCSGPGGVASLVPLMFWYVFSLLLLMLELPELD